MNEEKYPRFDKDAIFLFNSGSFCFQAELQDFLAQLKTELAEYRRQFHIVFIFCDHEIFMCNMESEIIISKEVSDDLRESLKRDTFYSIGRKKEYDNKISFFKTYMN